MLLFENMEGYNTLTAHKEHDEISALFHDDLIEIHKALEKLIKQRSWFIKSQVIIDSIQKWPRNRKLPEEIEDKLSSIFLLLKAENGIYSFTDEDNKQYNILSIDYSAINTVLEISKYEKDVIKMNLITGVKKQSDEFMEKLTRLKSGAIKLLNTILLKDSSLINSSETDIFRKFIQLKEIITTYNITFSETNTLLNNAVELKYDLRNKMISENVDCLEDSASKLHLTARVFRLKIEYLILSSHSGTFDAMLALHELLKKKDKETSSELNKLESEITAYESLKGTEFLAIIKQYKKKQKSLYHLKWTLKELRGLK